MTVFVILGIWGAASVGLGMIVGAFLKEDPGVVPGAPTAGHPVALCPLHEVAAADPNRRLASGKGAGA